MHQTVTGVISNSGFELTNERMPKLPPGKIYYSGDIHDPQKVGVVQYIGAPHPIAFGDDYPCRMLELGADFLIEREIELNPPLKHMLDISAGDILDGLEVLPGDQVKIRVTVPLTGLSEWPAQEARIREWAAQAGVTLAAIEPTVQGEVGEEDAEGLEELLTDPAGILDAFIEVNPMDVACADLGRELFRKMLRA